MSRWGGAYLVSHLGTGVNVEAQVVVGQLGGLFLQLPGESDLPEAERQVLSEKKNFHSFQKVHKWIQIDFFFFFFLYLFLQCWPTSALLDALHRSVHEILLWCIITFAIYTVARQFYTPHNLPEVGGNSTTFVSVWQLMPGYLHVFLKEMCAQILNATVTAK